MTKDTIERKRYTMKEVASHFCVTRTTVYRWVKKSRLRMKNNKLSSGQIKKLVPIYLAREKRFAKNLTK